MTICLDASVVLKLLIFESGSEEAVEWLDTYEGELIAPTFLLAEVASVLQWRVRMGDITVEEREDALEALESIRIRPIWAPPLFDGRSRWQTRLVSQLSTIPSTLRWPKANSAPS